MRKQLRRAFCPKCGHRQTFERYGVHHGLHFLLSIFTCGLWLVSWIALIAGEYFRPWHCEQCGKQQLGLKSLPDARLKVRRSGKIESLENDPVFKSRAWVSVFSIGFAAVIGIIDYFTGPQISLVAVYLIPVYLGAWFGGLLTGMLASLTAALLMLACELQWGDFFTNPFAPYINALVRLSIFIGVSFLVSATRRLYRNDESLVEKAGKHLDPQTR